MRFQAISAARRDFRLSGAAIAFLADTPVAPWSLPLGCTLKSASATLVLIGILFYVACNIDGDLPQRSAATSHFAETTNDTWRRTAQGWEKTSDWQEDVPVIAPEWIHVGSIHPALVASFQLLISLGALVAWTPAAPARQQSGDSNSFPVKKPRSRTKSENSRIPCTNQAPPRHY